MTKTAPADIEIGARDPRRALIAAALVAGVMALQLLVGFLESWVMSAQSSVFVSGVLVPQLLASILPKVVGVFLVLWIWPSRADDRVILVLARALVAAVVGCVLAVLVGIVYTVISFGVRFADLGTLPYAPLNGFVSAIVAFAPLVMLVTLAQWAIGRGARL